MCGGACRALECPWGHGAPAGLLVGPWQYQCRPAGWELGSTPPGIPTQVPTRARTTPRTPRTAHYRHTEHVHPDGRFELVQGDPRGVKRTGHPRHAQGCVGTAATLRPELFGRSLAPSTGINLSILSISQYFSVFSISKVFHI